MNVYKIDPEPTRLTEGRDHDIDMRDLPGRINFAPELVLRWPPALGVATS